MSDFNREDHPHRRRNPLTGDWVLVSPHRAKRPWQGQQETQDENKLPAHDPECYLCAGNRRVSGVVNEQYEGPWVFDNDFAALQMLDYDIKDDDPLMAMEAVSGLSRVLCFSERHDLTLPELPEPAIVEIVNTWCDQWEELSRQFRWVQIFENKGAANGCSNPHPHGQIWAGDFLPTLIGREDQHQAQYLDAHNSSLLLDYAYREQAATERVVCENDDWIVVVPWWASWPFETLLLPLSPVRTLGELEPAQRQSLAAILRQLTIRYDNLFKCSFPYSMGWHGAPAKGQQSHWQLHAHFYPPLLRSATVKKFMVGYEMLAEIQRDLTPEQAAQRLRELPAQHYRDR